MQPRPPSAARQQRVREIALQSAEEDEVSAHKTLSLLWNKVKTHYEWQQHIEHRDATLKQARKDATARAAQLRKEAEAAKEARTREQEEKLAKKTAKRDVVLKKPEAMETVKDLRYHPLPKRKHKEPSKEKLEQLGKAWVTTGKGGYDFRELESANYVKAFTKAEQERKKEIDSETLKLKRQQVLAMRQKENIIMYEKAGLSARNHLPVKNKTPQITKQEGDEENEDDEDNDDDDDEEAKTLKRREAFSAMNGAVKGCLLPDFTVASNKKERKAMREEKKLVTAKTEKVKQQVDSDIDAAAKLLILHAHMLRKSVLEAKRAEKEAQGEGEVEA